MQLTTKKKKKTPLIIILLEQNKLGPINLIQTILWEQTILFYIKMKNTKRKRRKKKGRSCLSHEGRLALTANSLIPDRFTPCGGGILFGIFSTSFACHSSLKTSINWILSTLKGSVISVFLKYELFLYILKSTKTMNKFDRVSAKLQIYFQTRVFYIF